MIFDYIKSKFIIDSQEYKKIVLILYVLDRLVTYNPINKVLLSSRNQTYIIIDNLTQIYKLLHDHKLLNKNNIISECLILEEIIIFNNKIYKLINLSKLLEFIKIIQPNIIKYNIIIHLINNIKHVNIYPTIKYIRNEIYDEITKLKNEVTELKKIKNDINDIKSIINYINTNINNNYKFNNSKLTTQSNDYINFIPMSYSLYMPNIKYE
jgi:hypothetical protein